MESMAVFDVATGVKPAGRAILPAPLPTSSAPAIPKWGVRDFLVNHRVRITAGICLAAAMIGLATGAVPHNPADLGDPFTVAGLALLLCGLGLRSWAAGILRKGLTLTTSGPYRMCRHPLYLGSLLMLAGALVIFPGVVVALPTFGFVVALLLLTITREEERVAMRYGPDWTAYLAETPHRLTPSRLRGLGARWSASQWLRNREYQAAVATVVLLAAVRLWLSVFVRTT